MRTMDRIALLPLCLFTALAGAPALLCAQSIDLRLVPLRDGLRQEAPGHDLARLLECGAATEAAKVGLDLASPSHPLFASAFRDGRLYYLFFKSTENAFGERAWLVQRIKKIERTWAAADAAPQQTVSFQVEAFKTLAGSVKGFDQHYGSFALREAARREVDKEYEIGFGTVAGVADGAGWPFDDTQVYHALQSYDESRDLFDRVAFKSSRRWTLTVSLAQDGSWTVRAPELGIDAPKTLPDAARTRVEPDQSSRALVLAAGVGPKGLRIGSSTVADATALLGAPLEDVPAGRYSRNVSYRGSLTCNFDGKGHLNTVITRTPFAGRTDNGIAHGMSRAEVEKALGAPPRGERDAPNWAYPGLLVMFDGLDTVWRLVVVARER